MFNVASINLCTEVEGPFKRVAIWFQGCKKHCPSCCNKDLQEIVPRNFLSLEEVFKIIVDAKRKFEIEGVTFLGGEPTLQIELPLLAKRLRDNNIGTILFTGYKIEELSSFDYEQFDMIIDGEFLINNLDTKRNMIGSSNQRIILITDRYKDELGWFNTKRHKEVEINISDGFYFNGDVFKLS